MNNLISILRHDNPLLVLRNQNVESKIGNTAVKLDNICSQILTSSIRVKPRLSRCKFDELITINPSLLRSHYYLEVTITIVTNATATLLVKHIAPR
ncbi:hypothetical protein MHOCP_15490 [Moorella humiferrea]